MFVDREVGEVHSWDCEEHRHTHSYPDIIYQTPI